MEINEKEWISEFHGMELDPIADDSKRDNENGILFLAEYYYLKHLQGEMTHADIAKFQIITENIAARDKDGEKIRGLYDRGAGESLWEDKEKIRTISHDNLTAIAGFSYLFRKDGLAYHKQIAAHGRKNLWRFDNVYPEKPRWARFMHPRDIVYWSYLDGKLWAKFMIWYPILEMIYSCYEAKEGRPRLHEKVLHFFKTGKWLKTERYIIPTSGKLMTFARMYPIKDKFIGKIGWKICSYFISKNFSNGWKEVFNIYYRNPENLIKQRVNKQYEKNKRIF